jgi:proline dehydrogenase
MGVLRRLLLAGSQSERLRERATRYRFVRRAVSRFMPGETLDDALGAARALRDRGMSAVLSQLGENVTDREEAAEVVGHYLLVAERVHEAGLDAEISVKLTHLGLDLGPEVAVSNLSRIAERAEALGGRVWVDMEGSSHTRATLEVFRRVQRDHGHLGLCLQSYLYRTEADLDYLIPLGAAIRLVKGAYKEPRSRAFPHKRDVDENFFRLARRLLNEDALRAGVWTAIGTHDPVLIRRISEHAAAAGIPKAAYEFDLLFGIRRDEQERLVHEGHRVRVLVSYGPYWFPWYMRRLAERPANVLFVLRSLLGG